MIDKKKLHQILSSLWKNDDSVGKTYYNQALQDVQTAIDLQEEPVSEELEEACEQLAENARKHKAETSSPFFSQTDYRQGVIDGAKWQKEHLWKPANGDDLPEIDREVIAILDYDFGHYKVVYAHRPNPNGWNGTNIDTEEKEHFEPVIYDKRGWNQPHVLYWLDAKLPYEENKITK